MIITPQSNIRALVFEALPSAPKEILEQALQKVWVTHPSARSLIKSYFLVTESEVAINNVAWELVSASDEASGLDNDKEVGTTDSAKQTNGDQLRPRFALCVNCERDFDVTRNTSTSCKYHPAGPTLACFSCERRKISGLVVPPSSRDTHVDIYYRCCDSHAGAAPCEENWHMEPNPLDVLVEAEVWKKNAALENPALPLPISSPSTIPFFFCAIWVRDY
ncbi:hypothetical protein N7532_008887 [Penicillium argentinense]|uniref:Uncharacterized protein n=1 Tax=Penicillium argentinense TaxID=1131581 RepID=A0A9W9EY88_9EURO|nr:uncharacterized protein N7532_008887 [Penicillium argentinense]KAJ5090203.1 hypothetical protein N7532_008887 [Penicillium argentinense]